MNIRINAKPESDVSRQYAMLSNAWNRYGGLDVEQRKTSLLALRASLLAHAEDYVKAISDDFRGRSRHETLLTEINVVTSAIDYALPRLARWAKPSRQGLGFPFWPARGAVLRQPRGVAGIIAPGNYPLQLALVPLVSALSAGCRSLLKPSELTPRTAELIEAHLAETLDPDVTAVVRGGAAVAAELSRLPLDVLLFTGSHPVGLKVAEAAAANLTPLVLELGGKCPVIVDRSADIKQAAEAIVAGKLINAGQTCVGPDYVLVPSEHFDALVPLLQAAAVALYPDAAAKDYSAIILDRDIARLKALEVGQRIVPLLPQPIVAPRYRPALVLAPDLESNVMTREIFGPLLPIIPYTTIDDAIAVVGGLPPPLVIYWFGQTGQRFDTLVRSTASGSISVNETVVHFSVPALPFGGVGASGFGRYHGKAGFDAFSNERAIFYQSAWSATRLLRPPFGALADGVLRRLLR